MFYAKMVRKATDTPTVWSGTGRPHNFEVYAFDTQAERQAAIDAAWSKGGNGFKCSRKDVEGYYGRDFAIMGSGEVNDAATVELNNDWGQHTPWFRQ